MPRIFDPFFTTKHSSSALGTGLGLSLVYSIAEQAGLGLQVENGPGSGASFSVWIPVNQA
jgi:signal transduction histidine kinase